MRVTAGKLKNRPIETKLKGSKVVYRPTSDKTRQAVFNILLGSPHIDSDILENSVIADICCGSGSFGIEAISRGAKFIYFVDIEREQIELTRRNIDNLGLSSQAKFIGCNATQLGKLYEKCDIAFVDAPYRIDLAPKILDSLIKAEWMRQGGIVITEVDKKDDVSEINGLELIIEREYGKTKLLFFKKI